LDPDFVELSGVTVGPQGSLSVARGQTQVRLEASESSDPGDNLGHVTLNATVTTTHAPKQTVSGAETGKVVLALPLLKSRRRGRTYTISWSATFDNGNHMCPSSQTPENTQPRPFVLTVH
jgi:CelD/BcsL family acetyltransferase involved in cellulose biosynthesis